jgi:basic membrane protein A
LIPPGAASRHPLAPPQGRLGRSGAPLADRPSRFRGGRCALALASALLSALASAQPALILEPGGKGDKSFGEAAHAGAERWREATGQAFLEFEIATAPQREQAALRFAQRGAGPIVGIGFPQAAAIEKAAREYPKTQFAIVDAVVDLPNVQSFVYREHEASFLAGMAAAMASKSGKVGMVGGMDIPLVRKFACGYEQGARYADPKVEVRVSMVGTTPAAWTDPARGGELAKAQVAQGVDVVFCAAGTSGLGALRAAKDAGILAIGVDSNQNGLYPGTVLTSVLKRVDLAVLQAFKGVQPGVTELGLAESGVGLAMDEHNAALVTPAMRARLDEAREAIVAGRLKVIDYTRAMRCAP